MRHLRRSKKIATRILYHNPPREKERKRVCRFRAVSGMKNASFGLNWSVREESIESRSQMSVDESVLSRRHEIVGRARRWISMNENTLQCVIKTNSNMNNSLIIGESFFLLYHACLYRFFLLTTLVLYDFLSFSFSLAYIRNIVQGEFSSLSLPFTSTNVQSSSFISIRSDSSYDHSDLTSFSLQDYSKRRLLEFYFFFFFWSNLSPY